MNKLRENTGVVLWILVISFGVIWVLQDSGAFDVVGATGGNIAVVDGEAITYDEYVRAVDAQVQNYQQQTGQTLTAQQIESMRDGVFNGLIENRLREREMKRLGIAVTDDELYEMVMGDRPHQIITSYFGDGQGGVDRVLLQNFIDNPDARQDWIQLEEYLRNERRREKLDNLIAATVHVSNADVMEENMKRNGRADAQFIALRYAELPDDSIAVTDRDLKRFYDDNREDFARQRAYTISYVTLSKAPTDADSSLIRDDLEALKNRFETAEDDSLFLSRHASETPYNATFLRRDEVSDGIGKVVFANPQAGTVYGPIFTEDGQAHLVKVVDVRRADEQTVRARHILIRAPEAQPGVDRAAARQQAQDIKGRLQQGEDFAALAAQFSADGSAQSGGDLGWFGPGRMVAPFQQAAFSAPIGQVVGPVETQFGYHLIEVLDRANQEVKLVDYAQNIRPSVETLNDIAERLDDLQYYAAESGEFAQEAERAGFEVQQMQVEQDQEVLPGLGRSRNISRFLEGADEGDVSDVIELDEQFVVLSVAEIQPEGYRSFDEVKAELEPRVKIEKKKALQRRRLEQALAAHGFGEQAAQAAGASVRDANAVNFNEAVTPGLGREPKFTGTVLGMKKGQVSDVIEGENAVFVVKVEEVYDPPAMTDQARESLRQQLYSQRAARIRSQWLTSLREQADVTDNRRVFQQ